MNDAKTNFGKMLDIVGYTGDKDELYNSLFGLCYFNALVDLIEILPEDKREEAGKQILETKDQQQAENVKKYFNETQITEALRKSSEKIFQDYYNSIKPSLSQPQIIELNNYLGSVYPQTA